MSSITKKETGGYHDRFWYPRFWDGMTLGAWLKVLRKGKYRVAPIRWAMAGIVTGLAATVNTPFATLQQIRYGTKIRETKLAGPPIFIIGHWRSGTTLLHEYMIRDPRFTFMDTYACFAPSHFLVTRHFLRPLVSCLMPKKRPMDNMAAGFDRPQEDEFALCSLGIPSPYLRLLFPNNGPIDDAYLTLRNVSPAQRSAWLDGMEWLLKSLTVQSPRQVILKSPPHTARIRAILERFPDAKFVHIHRDPRALFPSTVNLWMRLATDEGCQRPKGGPELDEYVFSTFNTMYEAFEADLPLLKEGQFCDVGYDELVQNPVGTIEKTYAALGINRFEAIRPEIEAFAATQKSYKKNRFELAPEIVEQINTRWADYIAKYGYQSG